MTKAGVGFIAAGVVVYVIGSQTQVGWLYLFDALIWSMLALSFLLPRWNLMGLRIERQVWLGGNVGGSHSPATPVEEEEVQVTIKVSNRGRMSRNLIKVVEDSPLDEPSKRPSDFLVSSIGARSTATFSYTSTCYKRGRYRSAMATLETAAPMGLFVHRRRYDLPLRITVYPPQQEMGGVLAARDVWTDQGQRFRSAGGTELYGSRDYYHGDSLRRVHWRNTARRGQFMVKEYEENSQGPVLVAFESRRDWGQGKESTFEYSIKAAASLARHSGYSGRSVGILVPPSPLLQANWLEALDYLAGMSVGDAATLDELTGPVRPGQTLVALVPAAAPETVPCLLSLAARDVRLVAVLLDGFTEGEAPEEFVSRLGGTGAGLVRCSRGNLKSAVDALGQSMQVAA